MRFQLAAQLDQNQQTEEELVEFDFGEKVLHARLPVPGQLGMLYAAIGSDNEAVAQAEVHRFLSALMSPADYRALTDYLRQGLLQPADLFGGTEANPKGMIETIIEAVAARPTNPPSGSSASPETGGRRSTGRVRPEESTPSD